MLAALALWWAGGVKAHVIHFNLFIIALIAGTVAAILLVARTTRQGEQVTRDKLVDREKEGG